MNLKHSIKITKYDKDNFYFDFSGLKVKKITSRMLPNLLGFNNFNSVGSSFLDRYGLIEFSDIEEWYKVRGEIAEKLAHEYLIRFFQNRNEEIELKKHTLQMYQGYDMFHPSYNWGNEHFGGVPDITIKGNENYVVEVKSKNMKYFGYIVEQKNIPKEELYQGFHLASLMNYTKVIMAYVFFNDEQEELIKKLTNERKTANDILLETELGLTNVVIRLAIRDVSKEIKELQQRAKKELHRCFEQGEIPIRYFSEEEQEQLKELVNTPKVITNDFTNDTF